MISKAHAPSPRLLRVLRAISSDRTLPCLALHGRSRWSQIRRYTSPSSRVHSSEGRAEPKAGDLDLRQAPTHFRKEFKDEVKASKAASKHNDNSTRLKPLSPAVLKNWEVTVGIEIHAELSTARKLFSSATTTIPDSPSPPNTQVSAFDAALPGAQPRFQKETLLPALRAALALNCEIQRKSTWDRKHYFWWDQPNGYQITQYYEPFAKDGFLYIYPHDEPDPSDLPQGQKYLTIGIKQIQMEQDTAKTTSQPPTTRLIDLNRVSHPLIEIITLPQIHTPKTAAAVVRKIQSILRSVGANTTGMEMGGLRADVNVSVQSRKTQSGRAGLEYGGVKGLGQRVEIKNLSSFKMVEDAITVEASRQINVLDDGESVVGETRRFDGTETRRIRGKEGEVDYRYMPDPDLGSVFIGDDLVKHLRDTLPPLPDDILSQLTDESNIYNLTMKDAKTMLSLDDGSRLEYYFDTVHRLRHLLEEEKTSSPDMVRKSGTMAGNWILHELGSELSKREISWQPNRVPSPEIIADIIFYLLMDRITMPTARHLLLQALDSSITAESLQIDEYNALFNVPAQIELQGLLLEPLSEDEYKHLARTVIASNEELAEKIRRGGAKQEGKIMWFVGQMVRKGQDGRIQPDKAERFVRDVMFS